nr:Uncharacterised protein [Streptococcus thermophilus]
MVEAGYPVPPQQIPNPPRLRDFKVLRLPLLELLAIAFLVCLSIGDILFMTGGNGLLTFFIFLPLTVVILIVAGLTYPLLLRPVDDFTWDWVLLGVGVIGLVSFFTLIPLLAFLVGLLPSGVSVLVRRSIALKRWQEGFDPRLQDRQENPE